MTGCLDPGISDFKFRTAAGIDSAEARIPASFSHS